MITKFLKSQEHLISSVLVKEARQSLNSWVFIAQFLGVHAMLAFVTLAQMATLSQGSGVSFSLGRGVFWFLSGAYFLFVVPLTNINAVSSETQGGTIELVRMTGLGPRRIVWGKWIYQAIFIVMMATSIYPYIIIYHFASGSDVTEETLLVFFQMLGSLIFLGLSVGASSFGTSNIKSLIFLGVLGLLFVGGIGLYNEMRRSSFGLISVKGIFLLVGIGVPFMIFMLELAATRVASRVDGFSFFIRIFGLLLFLIPVLFMYLDIYPEFCLGVCMFVVVLVPWSAMMGAPILVAGPYRRYLRFGRLGKLLGRYMFYPGWVSGTYYAAVIVLTFVVILFGQYSFPTANLNKNDIPEIIYVFTSVSMLPFQICLFRAYFQKHETDWAFKKMIGVHIGLLLFAFGLGFLKVYFGVNITPWLSFVPSNALIFAFFGAMSHGDHHMFEIHQWIAHSGQVLIVLGLVVTGQKYSNQYKELETKAEELSQ